MTPLPYRVVRKRRENHDNSTLELEPLEDSLDPIGPGQFDMLYAFGVGEVPISTSGDLEATGGRLEDAVGRDLLLVAGGVGLAPLRPALYHALAHREEYGEVTLLYGGRTPADLLFRRELERWRSRLDVDVAVTVDSATPDWRGRVGVVTKLIPNARFDPDETAAFVVGPEIMMRLTALALAERGIAREQISVSLERTMRCGIGLCGHCQLGPTLICRDGPIYPWAYAEPLLEVPQL